MTWPPSPPSRSVGHPVAGEREFDGAPRQSRRAHPQRDSREGEGTDGGGRAIVDAGSSR